MLLTDGPLTLAEFSMREAVPLSSVFRLVFTILQNRPDAVVYGSQALNQYVKPPRMTEDIDVFSLEAIDLAETIRAAINETFHIAIRIRKSADGRGLRLYQTSKNSRRHLIDIRPTQDLPPSQTTEGGVAVVTPPVLAAMKVIASVSRAHLLAREQDVLDLRRLLETFPELRSDPVVEENLHNFGASAAAFQRWIEIRTSKSPRRTRGTPRGYLSYSRRS